MKQRFDVAVAGSGPAGAACALRLARAGVSVALIDRRTFPREKLCGEYLNLGAVRELRDLEIGETLLSLAQTLDGMRLYAHDECAEFRLPSQAWSIPRTVLDAELHDAAVQAGAHPVHGRVRNVEFTQSGVNVRSYDASGEMYDLHSKYLVGADGMQSTVARLCGLSQRIVEERYAIGAHYRGVDLGRWIEMYASPNEYVALNPLDAHSANAVFVLRKEHLIAARDRLLDELTAFSQEVTRGRRTLHADGFETRCHAIGPLAHRTVRPTRERVLLAGDAAAFVDPFTGQGVYLALAGARDAAAAILSALAQPERERAAWRDYESAIGARLTERRRVAVMMKWMLALRFAARRAARAMRTRPDDFAPLIEAVSGNREAPGPLALAAAIGSVLR
jgi:menaquinone-9 beta-reductase